MRFKSRKTDRMLFPYKHQGTQKKKQVWKEKTIHSALLFYQVIQCIF